MLNAVIRAMLGSPPPGVTTLAGKRLTPGESGGSLPSAPPSVAGIRSLLRGLGGA